MLLSGIHHPPVISPPVSPSLNAVNRSPELLSLTPLARTHLDPRMALYSNLGDKGQDAVKAQQVYRRLFTVRSHFVVSAACSSNSSNKAVLPDPMSNIAELVNRIKTDPQSTEEIDKVVCVLERVISSDLPIEQVEENFAEKLDVLVDRMKEILEKINGKILWGRRGSWLVVPPDNIPSSLRGNVIAEIALCFKRVKKTDTSPREARKVDLTTHRLNRYKAAFCILEAITVDTSVRGQVAYVTLLNMVTEDRYSHVRDLAIATMGKVLALKTKDKVSKSHVDLDKGFEVLVSSLKEDRVNTLIALQLVAICNSKEDLEAINPRLKYRVFNDLLEKIRILGASKLNRWNICSTFRALACKLKVPDDLFDILIKMLQNNETIQLSDSWTTNTATMLANAVLGGQKLPEEIQQLLLVSARSPLLKDFRPQRFPLFVELTEREQRERRRFFNLRENQTQAVEAMAIIVKGEKRAEGCFFECLVETMLEMDNDSESIDPLAFVIVDALVGVYKANPSSRETIFKIFGTVLRKDIDAPIFRTLLKAISKMGPEGNRLKDEIIEIFDEIIERAIRKSVDDDNWARFNILEILITIAKNGNKAPEKLLNALFKISKFYYEHFCPEDVSHISIGLVLAEDLFIGELAIAALREFGLKETNEENINKILDGLEALVCLNDFDPDDPTMALKKIKEGLDFRTKNISEALVLIAKKRKSEDELEKLKRHKNGYIRFAARSADFLVKIYRI